MSYRTDLFALAAPNRQRFPWHMIRRDVDGWYELKSFVRSEIPFADRRQEDIVPRNKYIFRRL
ncbi:MAG: hypothetical protein CMK09_04535 [Ponticaulis sp.]|nr:hypothetical protein [Ponticaulis sp.]|tara:strand:- start:52076 stop:52264 length:189 start_codon:yes stop_codon:yes gene_type:complete